MAKIIIFGDIKTNNQRLRVDEDLKSLSSDADLVIANLEGPIVNKASPRPDKKGKAHASDESIQSAFEELSIGLLTFGNNHILDFDVQGLSETIDFAEAFDIAWVGASDGVGRGSYLYLNDELGVAVFSFAHREGPVTEVNDAGGYGPYALPECKILHNKIRQLVEQGYSILVSYHGGEEYFNVPWPRRLAWARSLVDAGALLVFSQHSHSVQPVYKLSTGFLAPGLGNTFFCTEGQKRHLGTEEGVCLVLDTDTKTMDYMKVASEWNSWRLILKDKCMYAPIDFDEKAVVSGWLSECKQVVFGGRGKRKPEKSDWWKNPARSVFFTWRVIMQKFSSVRDVDILLGSLPFIGSLRTKKSIMSAPDSFRY